MHKKHQGLDNHVYLEEGNDEDLDRIEVITTSSSSLRSNVSDEIGSQNLLTAHKNGNSFFSFRRGHANLLLGLESASMESIELMRRLRINQTEHEGTPTSFEQRQSTPTPTNMVRRWSQNLTRFSKNKRASFSGSNGIYRLPSRMVCEVEGQLLASSNNVAAAELEQLAQDIEQHADLMQDTAMSKQNRLETLRALPQSLATKRLLKQKIALTVEAQSKDELLQLSWRKRLANACLFCLLKLWRCLRFICNGLEIWYNELKTIEGHFGSNVCSYFKFLRWLFVLNLLLFVCTFAFVTLPQILYNANLPYNSTQELAAQPFHVLDLLTAEGSLQSSLLFYGSYVNASFSLTKSSSTYSIPHAYYMTMLLVYLFTFVVISTSVARSYRKSFIQSSGGVRSMYANKIFCSWDFRIANAKAAELKHLAIYTELKEALNELEEAKVKFPILWRIWIFCARFVAHLLVCATIAGLCVGIWVLLQKYDASLSAGYGKTFIISFGINFLLLFLQAIFSWIAKMEDYRSPKRSLHVNLVRNFMLEFSVVGVLMYFWLTEKYADVQQQQMAAEQDAEVCWETALGQEIYRLLVADFIIDLLFLPVLHAIRVFILRRFWPRCSRPEFDISQKSLGLVYNQTLLWIGHFFSPLLAGLMIFKLLLMFYMKKALLLHLCKSPLNVWRSMQTQTVHLVFSFLSLLGVLIALGYIMTQIPVSLHCGPFRDYNFMFQIFIDGVLKLRDNKTVWRILMTLIRPAVVGVMLSILAIMVYYVRAKSRARCIMVKMLKEMLYMEVKDKEYLLASIANITKDREWLLEAEQKLQTHVARQHKRSTDELFVEPGATWRYAHRRSVNGNMPLSSSTPTTQAAAAAANGGSRIEAAAAAAQKQTNDCILRIRNV